MEPEISASAPNQWVTKLGVKLHRWKQLLKRRWWIPLLTVSLALAYEGWVLSQKATLYQSVGQLIVNPRLTTPEANQYQEDMATMYATQRDLLQGEQVKQRARNLISLEHPTLSGEVDVSVSIRPRTSIFEVVGTGTNPEYTQQFVNALMKEFIASERERRVDQSADTLVSFGEELKQLRKEIDAHEAELQAFIQKENMAFWETQREEAVRYLSELKTRREALRTELRRLENLSAEHLLAASEPPPAAGTEEGRGPRDANPQSQLGAELKAQYLSKSQELLQQKARLAEMSKVWTPVHPKLIALKDEIAATERAIDDIKALSKEATQSRIASIRSELESLELSLKESDAKVLEASKKTAEYDRLKQNVARTENLYEKLAGNNQSLMTGTRINSEPLSISQPATVAVEVPPGTVKHLLTGLIIGLVVGGLLLFLIDRADDRISSASEMIEHFSEPILGQIPNVSESRDASGLPLLQREDERYQFAESFRSLRSSLVFMPNQGELRTLIVTSAIPNEGKSTVASNLAITMALAGARVLLVDADLRRGDLAALFDIDGRVGLSNVLREEVAWHDAVQATRYSNLTLLPRGPVTNQSGELLLVPVVDAMLSDFKSEFDLTIFNTSPILATDDTPTLAPNFDGTLMIMRAQFTSARLTRNALNALYQRQVNVLGMILNCIDTQMPDYYYYRYPKYYAA
jgi:succinoglycan biosynthesis transport protein ExoP